MIIESGGGGAGAVAAPLYSFRDELEVLRSSASILSESGTRAARISATNRVPAGMWTNSGAAALAIMLADGTRAWANPRNVAAGGLLQNDINWPLYRSGALVPADQRRPLRYICEWLMWRGALEAGSLLESGLQRNNGGTIQVLPSDAFNYAKLAFRSLDSENGGNWGIVNRPVQGGAAVITPTAFTPLVPRLFRMEYTYTAAGVAGGVSMSIDGQPVGSFSGAADFPPPAVFFPGTNNSVIYGWSFGSQLAAGAERDFMTGWGLDIYED